MVPHAYIMSLLTGSIVATSTSIVPPVAESAAPTEALVLSLRLQQLGSCFRRGLLHIAHLLILLIATIVPRRFLPPRQRPHPPVAFPGTGHEFVPRKATDSRSPCPALNTLANHGYLPHNGRDIHASQIVSALREGFHLSLPLSVFLTFGSYLLLGQFRRLSLGDLARHGAIEHDASLARRNARATSEYAPCKLDEDALKALLEDSADGSGLTAHDIARARVRRENSLRVPLDHMHAEIARGEMALVLGIFGQHAGASAVEASQEDEVPLELLSEWWNTERFPDNWRPTRIQGLLQTVRAAADIRKAMEEKQKAR
ncbi:Chloroperoxidase 1 [Heterobasidion irregulare TC 32-1]|uniref:Chloroperoxidase 1 n=1 Tax=Heterobasidion irregulare (strain TC 32-1) TaxID=747525 RepID=W4KCK9_HETIT|nr:Chloroperoxidase 1 [Heterobasidion irregulare TC 32-1]ETW83607.1 Chloroperoxidase 1 [Heterobasidion irregulare TC 32-1]